MSTKLALINDVERYPDDKTRQRVLADWIQEYEGLSAFSALRSAVKYAHDFRTHKEAKIARGCVTLGSIFRDDLIRRISAEVDREDNEEILVNVVRGRRWPEGKLDWVLIRGVWQRSWKVTVGARWVLQIVYNLQLMENEVYRPTEETGWSN